jgi:hypothetical protein
MIKFRRGLKGEIILEGLSDGQIEKFEGMLGGGFFMKGVPGDEESKLELTFTSSFRGLPDPITDDEMLPFWKPLAAEKTAARELEFINFGVELAAHRSPSILIKYLCGYGYSPERYRINAELLEGFGFDHMRSKRKENGRFSEAWFLSSLYGAKGELKEKIDLARASGEKDLLKIAVEHIARRASFGTLDVVVQRLTAVID